ncbi:hypothetical protein EGT74_19295 [Chitinophaga lutea]|uniref:N-acetyltransferase n=1 Tax=Chitinophaga lutea TaxID=2488634 RepID=A0A3N4PYK8_9BACT|nr:hypothetical protein [Chitinophaga lutea]RPE09157.1 hypothetical protein EGT74_19295 [Chitinophaga lutea]
MTVENPLTGEKLEVIIEPAAKEDFKVISKDKIRFSAFDWNKYKEKEVYKLRLKTDQTIQGLMCLRDFPPEMGVNALEIELLEVSAENRQAGKKLSGVAGCMIAFACRESFKRGYQGWVFLIPKTYLIEHYSSAYGFIHFPLITPDRPEGIMELDTIGAHLLIKKYLA